MLETRSLPQAERAAPAVQALLLPMPPVDDLAELWLDLQSRAEAASYFLSWHWIGAWLRSLPPAKRPAHLVVASHDGRVVGMAILGEQRWGIGLGRTLHLNQTGDPLLDAITIEHNGFLLDAALVAPATQALWQCLHGLALRYERIVMRHHAHGAPPDFLLRSARLLVQETSRPCWTVDLRTVRQSPARMPSGLSTQRNAHLRSFIRKYTRQVGVLRVDVATTAAQAQQWLERLLHWHQLRRQAMGQPSGFDTAYARAFHKRMIGDSFNQGAIQMLRVCAGDHELGYLYSFVHQRRVSYYQSGFNFELLDGKFSPGMVCLLLAIQHNAGEGHDVWDFLAGDSQYKQAFGSEPEELRTLTLERAGWLAWALACRRRWLALRKQIRGKIHASTAVLFAWFEPVLPLAERI